MKMAFKRQPKLMKYKYGTKNESKGFIIDLINFTMYLIN